jgi:aminopeptidase N
MKNKTLWMALVQAVACLWIAPCVLAAPFDFDAAPGRLPKNVVPLSYQVSLVPRVQTLSLTGTESIRLQVKAVTAVVQFNSLNERLEHVLFDGKAVKSVHSDDAKQLTTVTLMHPATMGEHVLKFAFTGKVETAPRGLFAQHYTRPDGTKGVLLSSQMEATDARRMFPCWDEPAFRASIQLEVTLPKAWASVSNMRIAKRDVHGELARVSFLETPKMPSYLIELTAGEIRDVSATSGGTRFGVWAVAGQEHDGETALRDAQQILGDYNDYFAYPFPLSKLDSIAIPGGYSGAMENWGAITYNDQALLVSSSSTLADKQQVFSIQAHEMAHQWFGDLVTMGWWDDIWLNESFASWMAARETAARNPNWSWWEREDAKKEAAMSADARAASHAIQQHVTDELQADESFDTDITYNKGEALLRMLESYLGDDVFRDGMRRYMKARAYSNATADDLWQALAAASGKDVSQIAADWTGRPGFPLVSVTASCDAAGLRTISLRQTRFLLDGSGQAEVTHWRVPLQIRTGADAKLTRVLLEAEGQKVAAGRCDEALSVNAGAIGYYRVRYDAATLATNTAQFGDAANGDRIALLDDQWALAQSSFAPLQSYLALAAAMHGNLDVRAWRQISEALQVIEILERDSPGHEAFAAFARSIVKPAAERLGWQAQADETPDISTLRQTLLADLGAWGDADTIVEAKRRFQTYLKDHASLSADQQATVLEIVAQNADDAVFGQLHQLAKSASNETERERDYEALASVRDPNLAAQVLQIAISGELPPQAATLRIRLVFGLAGRFHQASWKTFTANVDKLMQPYSLGATLILGQIVPEIYWDSMPLDELETWVKAHVPAEAAGTVARGMQTARFRLSTKLALVPAADAFVKSRQGT